MECPKCHFENAAEAKFCNECGSKLEISCSKCGKTNLSGSKFCNECGRDLRELEEAASVDYSKPQSYTPKYLADKILTTRSSIEGERKLVTVLFADVANYTAFSEKLDPEEVHQIMDECFKVLMDVIHKYEGTINQFTGDGVMSLFGAPVAHEDHAHRACYAALAIQKAIGEYGEKIKEERRVDFLMRIGLNSGPVIVGSIGDDLRMDYTAVGDTTNLASRMESMAKPGTIRVSRHTYKLARYFFQFQVLGKMEVKGKEGPQEVFELIKTGEVDTRIAASVAKGLTRFVGRKNPMSALMDAYDKARSASGQVVGVVGDAGVGKSRLILEFKNQLPRGEFAYFGGQCLHFGQAMAYLPILDILRSYFEIKEGDPETLIKKNMAEKILQLDEELHDVLPPFHELLSLEIEDDAYQKLNPMLKREKTFEAIRDLLIRESQNRPIILVVEDLHWIDKTSEEFLSYLIEWLANSPILLILLYRPEYTHAWGSKSYYNRVGLDQLTMKSSAALIQAILQEGEPVPELRELIINRAAGNPLYMEEFTHMLLENGAIQCKDQECALINRALEIQVPETIQGIIAARMDRLEDSLKRTMQVASVIGRDFAFRILETITEMREELKSYLLNLQGLEFIYEKRLFPELEYVFKHALTQEVAYNSLLQKRRKEIHEKIGRAIEALYPERLEEFYELLAYHYSLSNDKDKAVLYLDLANKKAAKVYAMKEAKSYFDEAMKILDTLPETRENQRYRISFLVNNSIVHQHLLKLPEYYKLLTRYEPMGVELDDPGLLGAFYARLGHCDWSFAAFDQSIQTLKKAAQLAEATGCFEEAGYAYMFLQWSQWFKGDYDQVLTLKEDVLRKMEQRFNLRSYVIALVCGSLAYSHLGLWGKAVEEGQKGQEVAEKFSDNSLISFAAWSISCAYILKGDLDRAIEYAELAVQKSPTPVDEVRSQGILAWAWCRAGDPRRGIENLSASVAVHRAGSFKPPEFQYTSWLGEGYWLIGAYDKASQTLQELLKMVEPCGARFYIGSSHRLLGEIALKTDPTKCAPHFEKSIAVLQEIKAENELALTYAGYGRLHKQQGDIIQARDYLNKALEIFERLGTLIEPGKVREELADLP